MDLMIHIYDTYLSPASRPAGAKLPPYHQQIESMMEVVRDQREKLAREVEKWCKERGV